MKRFIRPIFLSGLSILGAGSPAFAHYEMTLTPEQQQHWERIQQNWQYWNKHPRLMSAKTSHSQSLCDRDWSHSKPEQFHTRLVFSFIKDKETAYREVCISDRTTSFRPIITPSE